MQDYWNDPPDEPEPPEWYMMLDDVLHNTDLPQGIAEAIKKAMNDWEDEYAREQQHKTND